MNGQAICAMCESILPQQQGLSKGKTEESTAVSFDMLIAQLLGGTQSSEEGTEVIGLPLDLAELVQCLSDLEDAEQPTDVENIMSQLVTYFAEKMDTESSVYNTNISLHKKNYIYEVQPNTTKETLNNTQAIQPDMSKRLNSIQGVPFQQENTLVSSDRHQDDLVKSLSNTIEAVIQKLEGEDSTMAEALKEKLGLILEKITTYDLQKSEHIDLNDELKQQYQLMSLTRDYKKVSDESVKTASVNGTNLNVEEKKTAEKEMVNPLNAQNLELEKTSKEGAMNLSQVQERSKLNTTKQDLEFALPIEKLEDNQAKVNEEPHKIVDVAATDELKPVEGESETKALDIKPGITDKGLRFEDVGFTVHKDNINFSKIQNIDKIYMALQKHVLQSNGKEKSMLTVKLQPEELGSMKIQLEMVEGIVKGTIAVESESAKSAVQNHLQEMKNLIKNQEINLESLEVNIGNQSFGESNQPNDEENPFFRQRQTVGNALEGKVNEMNTFANTNTYTNNTLNLLA